MKYKNTNEHYTQCSHFYKRYKGQLFVKKLWFLKLGQTECPILGAWRWVVYSYVTILVYIAEVLLTKISKKESYSPCCFRDMGHAVEGRHNIWGTSYTPDPEFLSWLGNDKINTIEGTVWKCITALWWQSLLSDCHSWSLLNTGTPAGCCCLIWKVQEQFRFIKVTLIFIFFESSGDWTRTSYMLVSHHATELHSPVVRLPLNVSITLGVKPSGDIFIRTILV